MRFITVGFLSILLMAMGGRRPIPPASSSPAAAAVDSHYSDFKKLGAQYGAKFITNTVSFAFRSFFGSVVGMCTMSSDGNNHVDLSPSAWNRGDDTLREMLLFHELGHCLLGRGHLNTTFSSGAPESLMNSWLFDEHTYLANRDAYLKELFTANAAVRSAAHLAVTSGAKTRASDGGCEFSKAIRKRLKLD